MTHPEIAKFAFSEANDIRQAQGLPPLPYTDFKRAEVYVDQGYESLSSTGYDPDYFSPSLAEFAVIEYIKSKLVGIHFDSFDPFVKAKKRWGEAAAIEKHYGEALKEREELEEAKARTRITGRLI